jgi:hypothetical protein
MGTPGIVLVAVRVELRGTGTSYPRKVYFRGLAADLDHEHAAMPWLLPPALSTLRRPFRRAARTVPRPSGGTIDLGDTV